MSVTLYNQYIYKNGNWYLVGVSDDSGGGGVTYELSGSGATITLTGSDSSTSSATVPVPTKVSDLTNDSGFITSSDIPVTSVNSKTGAVTLSASDVGALPDSTTIPQGTVTSVRVQATSPVQSSTNTAQSASLNTTISLADGYGDTKNPYAAKNANKVLAGPSSGSDAAPSFRALVASDIPSLTVSKISDFPSTMTPSSHTHGSITNDGKISSDTTVASGDKIVITDSSASSAIKRSGIAFGTGTTTFLRNDGSWQTPAYPVTSVNTKTGAVSLTASDVGALPSSTSIPTKVSDLTNDSGYITGYTETDPTVPSWAKASSKPTYTASEVGALADTTDVTKWNEKTLTVGSSWKGGSGGGVPYFDERSSTTAGLKKASTSPTVDAIVVWDSGKYIYSTTPSASDNSTKVATTAYVDNAVSSVDALPSQSGNSGKFLTTDGTAASWATITIPSVEAMSTSDIDDAIASA